MPPRPPSFHQLNIFATVVREGSFRKAGEALLLSEPAISQQVKSLEQALGMRLFDRLRGRPIRLTDAGHRLLGTCEEIFRLLKKTTEEFEALRRTEAGSVAFGARHNFCGQVLPFLYASFQRKAPGIVVRVSTGQRDSLLDALMQKELDLVVVEDPECDPRLASTKLAGMDMVLVGPPGHPLAQEKGAPFHSLAGERLIVAGQTSATRALQAKAAECGVPLNVVWDTGNAEAQVSAVNAGMGVAPVSFYGVRARINAGVLALLRVDGFPIRMDWFIFWRPDESSAAILEFKAHLLNHQAEVEALSLCPIG